MHSFHRSLSVMRAVVIEHQMDLLLSQVRKHCCTHHSYECDKIGLISAVSDVIDGMTQARSECTIYSQILQMLAV